MLLRIIHLYFLVEKTLKLRLLFVLVVMFALFTAREHIKINK